MATNSYHTPGNGWKRSIFKLLWVYSLMSLAVSFQLFTPHAHDNTTTSAIDKLIFGTIMLSISWESTKIILSYNFDIPHYVSS